MSNDRYSLKSFIWSLTFLEWYVTLPLLYTESVSLNIDKSYGSLSISFLQLILRVNSLFMKFPIAPESISALALSRLTFTYIKNSGVVSVTIIIRRSSLRFSAI